MGMYATRDIKVGELIVSERPLLSIDGMQLPSQIEAAVEELSPQQRDVYFALLDSDSLSENSKSAEGIWRTNSVKTGTRGASILPLFSRINHSCRPNVHHSWNEKLGMEMVHAVLPISAGHEICTSYLDTKFMTREERQNRLRGVWGFVCECEVCSLTGDALKESDNNRMGAKLAYDNMFTYRDNLRRASGEYEKCLKLLTKEDMVDPASVFGIHFDMHQACTMGGNSMLAKKYAQLALENLVLACGDSHPDVRRYSEAAKGNKMATMGFF